MHLLASNINLNFNVLVDRIYNTGSITFHFEWKNHGAQVMSDYTLLYTHRRIPDKEIRPLDKTDCLLSER